MKTRSSSDWRQQSIEDVRPELRWPVIGPCPHCGQHEALLEANTQRIRVRFHVWCPLCDMTGPAATMDRTAAVDAWNRLGIHQSKH